MNTLKRIGIWMDGSTAHLTEFTTEPLVTENIDSAFSHQSKAESLTKSENLMHHKEQSLNGAYYKKIGEKILEFDEALLFGPTNAKVALFNHLREDHRFSKIKINVLNSEKMTINQEHKFVREHFSKH